MDADALAKHAAPLYKETEVYKLLLRALKDQAVADENGVKKPKPKKDIKTDSLQNPSDPDATYRMKAGKGYKGYVGNFVETFGEEDAIITQFGYEPNTHSDSKFSKDVIDELGEQEETVTIIADGAYGGEENIKKASENNINLIPTTLLGANPPAIIGDFEVNEEEQRVVRCPHGHSPDKQTYYTKTDSYRVLFMKEKCDHCPHKEACVFSEQKKNYVVKLSRKAVNRARYLKKLSTEDVQNLTKKRNAVEGIPSLLRRVYGIDRMPVRGFLRSKLWYTIKIGAINVKRVLARGILTKNTDKNILFSILRWTKSNICRYQPNTKVA